MSSPGGRKVSNIVIRGPVETALNITAVIAGVLGFVLSILWFRRRREDWPESVAMAVFVFMQCAIWAVEGFYWVTVVLRLTGHGVGVMK